MILDELVLRNVLSPAARMTEGWGEQLAGMGTGRVNKYSPQQGLRTLPPHPRRPSSRILTGPSLQGRFLAAPG